MYITTADPLHFLSLSLSLSLTHTQTHSILFLDQKICAVRFVSLISPHNTHTSFSHPEVIRINSDRSKMFRFVDKNDTKKSIGPEDMMRALIHGMYRLFSLFLSLSRFSTQKE
jgi:hypothetical protein